MILSGFSTSYSNTLQSTLGSLLLQAFQQTIINLSQVIEWDISWCSPNVDIAAHFTDTVNKRLLLQDDINIDLTFYINNELYLDYFNDYNVTRFIQQYQTMSSDLILERFSNVTLIVHVENVELGNQKIKSDPDTSSSNEPNHYTLIFGLISGILLCLLVLICIYWKRKQNKWKDQAKKK